MFGVAFWSRYDRLTQPADINVPVYLIIGVYYRDTPNDLVEEYFAKLNAPRKGFDSSAHLAPLEEPGRFSKLLEEKVLRGALEPSRGNPRGEGALPDHSQAG